MGIISKGLTLLFLLTQTCIAQWFWQNPLPQGNPLSSVYFTDSNTGWVAGNCGTILRTTNGGNSWISQISGTSNNLSSVYFIDSNTGWVVGYNEKRGYGLILKTTDGGDNWITESSKTKFGLKSVYFIDSKTGWIVGEGGTIFKTTDGGGSR